MVVRKGKEIMLRVHATPSTDGEWLSKSVANALIVLIVGILGSQEKILSVESEFDLGYMLYKKSWRYESFMKRNERRFCNSSYSNHLEFKFMVVDYLVI